MAEFDREQYFYLLGIDPPSAATYVDSYRYGTNDPVGLITSAVGAVQEQNQRAVTTEFLERNPDYPFGDQEAAKALTGRVAELVAKSNMPFTADTMDFGYYQLQRQGIIEPKQ